MCEDVKCMHHNSLGCTQGLKMTCTRRYKFLGLKYHWHELPPRVKVT